VQYQVAIGGGDAQAHFVAGHCRLSAIETAFAIKQAVSNLAKHEQSRICNGSETLVFSNIGATPIINQFLFGLIGSPELQFGLLVSTT